MILGPEFFKGPTLKVAEALLGQVLCRVTPTGEQVRAVITELEAYDGQEDKACHACRGQTPRNAIMFGPGGYWYVYLCYGMHWMLNVVTGEAGYPAAILIRGLDIVEGPGRLTKHLSIDKTFNEKLACPETGLWLEKSPTAISKKRVQKTPRIGIDYAGPIWAKKEYRFVLRR